jgi:hypothetical protein
MSTVIRSCPGCKSLILSDTDQCPDCGHVFYERRKTEAAATTPATTTTDTLKNASLHEVCPHCGEMVRSGLVRCWSCKGFIREDVAARYRDLTSNPQPIIYSSIPADQRRDYLPPRNMLPDGVAPVVFDADEFVLGDGVGSSSPFEIDRASLNEAVDSPTADSSAAPVKNSEQPKTITQSDSTAAGEGTTESRKAAGAETTGEKTSRSTGSSSGSATTGGSGQEPSDDLLSIALSEQREVRKRRGERLAERQKKQMLVPCTCGAWIRVLEDQAGKSVRCRQCKQPVVIPEIRRKTEKKSDAVAVPKLDITWAQDAWFYSISPTSLVLKPGSLVDKHKEADLAVTPMGLHIVLSGGTDKKKKSLMGRSEKGSDRDAMRKQVHDQIAATGELKNLPNAEVHTIAPEKIGEIRLVQPILKAHESMFAGVPVFGEGRIAVFLPVTTGENEQSFCSFPLSAWRQFADRMKSLFSLQFAVSENGVPDQERSDTLSCFVNQSKIESIRSLIYYQKDPAFELELTGYKCKSCGIAVSEEGRKKNKLGGANGKGIAKAKCPKCSGKMGEEPLYRIKKAPEAAPAADVT